MDNGDIADRIGDLAIWHPALMLACLGKLDPIVSEFETEEDAAAYDLWFRAQLEGALASDGPLIPHEQLIPRMGSTSRSVVSSRLGTR